MSLVTSGTETKLKGFCRNNMEGKVCRNLFLGTPGIFRPQNFHGSWIFFNLMNGWSSEIYGQAQGLSGHMAY